MTLVDCSSTIDEYIGKTDWRINANANSGYSNAGMINNISGKIIANYWLDKVYNEAEGKAHRLGDYHIHDLDSLTGYCAGWSLRVLLDEGFNGVSGRVSSRAPKHLREALGQMSNFLGILQSEWAGAQAFSSFDTYLAPYVFVDSLSYTDVKKAIKQFVYNLNVPARWGQSPFTNITLDIIPPEDLADKKPTRNKAHLFMNLVDNDLLEIAKLRDPKIESLEDMTYKHFKDEMELIVKAYYEVMTEGDSNGQPFTFPIPTVNITEDFNWDSAVSYKIFENSAKMGCSYFQNFIGSQWKKDSEGNKVRNEDAYTPGAVRSMCPLAGSTKVFVKSDKGITIHEISDLVQYGLKRETEYSVFNSLDKKWVKIKNYQVHDNQEQYKITFSNGSSVIMGEKHLQPVLENTCFKDKTASELCVGDWIPFSGNSLTTDTALGSKLYGVIVGAYLGDGSKQDCTNENTGVVYSLSVESKDDETEKLIREFFEPLGIRVSTSIKDNLRSVYVGAGSYALIDSFITGYTALDKGISKKVYNMTKDFREGIIHGLMITDGSKDKNRYYTSSSILRDDLLTLCASLGQKALVSNEDTRETRFGGNPCWCISLPNRKSYGEFFLTLGTINRTNFYKITNIEKVENKNKLYCIEVEGNSPYFTLANGLITHNCRLQLDLNELLKRGNGLFGSAELTGSIGVVTINMARLGYLFKGKPDKLIEELTRLMDLASSTLEKKRIFIQEMFNRGLYPYTARYLPHFNNHFSTIGVNGMNEMIRNFTEDKEDISSEFGATMAESILRYMRTRIKEYQMKTGNLYNLEATPAEGTTYRFAKEDKKRFSDIIQAGTKENNYYTNSSQLPADFTEDPYEALELQNTLQCLYTGGTVLHMYMSEKISSPEACKKFVKNVISNYQLPYITITPVFSVCDEHGYLNGEQPKCPYCEKETNVWTRVMGYFRPVSSFNIGKKGEHKERKFFKETEGTVVQTLAQG
jgi:anaerobic ribonucleoside-triphosphate reductase